MLSAGNNEKAYRTHLQEYSLAESVGNQTWQHCSTELMNEMQRFEEALEYAPVEVLHVSDHPQLSRTVEKSTARHISYVRRWSHLLRSATG